MTTLFVVAGLILGLLTNRYSTIDEVRWEQTTKMICNCGPWRI